MEPKPLADSSALAWQEEVSSHLVGVQWQWEHRSGWRDYDALTNKRIEVAYKDGRSFVLIKAGKKGTSPMGIFFTDMLQHDADTGKKLKVQRKGPESLMERLGRQFLVLLRSFDKANVVQRNFLEQEVEEDALAGIDLAPSEAADPLHKRGCCAAIARSPLFLPITSFVIFLNAIWLGYDAQFNTAPTLYTADWGFIFVENLFCSYFTVELLIRFLAYRIKRSCLSDGWFIFDSIMLILMMGEIWLLPLYMKMVQQGVATGRGGWAVLRMATMLKLVRLGRLVRIIKNWPELFTMCKAIVFAMRSTLITVILVVLLLYVFSIVFVKLLRSYEELIEALPDFKTIHGTMWLLAIEGVLLDGPKDTLSILVEHSYIMTATFLVFIGISAFTLVNMLIGIICNVVDEVSRQSKDDADATYLKNTMLEFLECHDDDNNRAIKKEEFRVLLKSPVIRLILTRFGVDVDDLKSMENNFFGHMDTEHTSFDDLSFPKQSSDKQECPDVPFSQFLRMVLRLRQTNSAKVTDVVDLREFIKKGMETHREHMDQRLRVLEHRIQEAFAVTGAPCKVPEANAAPSLNARPKQTLATEELQMPDFRQDILKWREATQSHSSSFIESSVTAESCPLRQEARGGLEQLLTLQSEISRKESSLEKEVLLSREQLSDIQNQVGEVCRLLALGRIVGSPDRHKPQAKSHPGHASPAQKSLLSSAPLGRTVAGDEISADDVDV